MIFLQFDPGQAPILNSGVEARPSEIVSYAANSEHYIGLFRVPLRRDVAEVRRISRASEKSWPAAR